MMSMTSHPLAKQSQDHCWCCKPQYPFWDQSSFNTYHWRIFSLVQLLEVGLPKCVAMKFSFITREGSFVHCCVDKLAVKVCVCVETSFANLKVEYKDFHASSPSQSWCEDFFVEYGDQLYLGKMTEMLLARCLLSYTFWKIVWLLVFARSLSYI